jgi:hypothetical protein
MEGQGVGSGRATKEVFIEVQFHVVSYSTRFQVQVALLRYNGPNAGSTPSMYKLQCSTVLLPGSFTQFILYSTLVRKQVQYNYTRV